MAERKKSTRFSLAPKKNALTSLEQITEEEKHMAREVWMQVENNYVVISKGLFTELFLRYPEYKEFFKDLLAGEGNVKIPEEVWLTPRFEKHMVQVLMPSLGNIVKHLNSPEYLYSYLIKLGKFHRDKRMKLKPEHVENLKEVFIETLISTLGPRFDSVKQATMGKIISAAFEVFESQLL